MAGSSTCLNSVVEEPLSDHRITHYPSAIERTGYVTEVGLNTTGEAVEWFANLAYGGRAGRAHAADYRALGRDAANMPPGAHDLLMVPVLGDGERDDPTLRGALVGLSLRHDRAALARALLEGVAFGIRDHLERLGAASTPPTELRVSGRSADLREWNQIKADVLGIPVIRIPGDAAARGVAMLAGLGVQMYRDPADATATACRADAPVEPDTHNHERYADVYARYRSIVASSLVHTTPEV